MLTVTQTRSDYPSAARPDQTHGWVLIRTDGAFDGHIGIMTEPYSTPDAAMAHLLFIEHLATVALAKILRPTRANATLL